MNGVEFIAGGYGTCDDCGDPTHPGDAMVEVTEARFAGTRDVCQTCWREMKEGNA